MLKKILYDQYQCFLGFLDKQKKYDTLTSKSAFLRLVELEKYLISNSDYCHLYYAWGLNAKDTSINDYIGRKEFLKLLLKAEHIITRRNRLNGLNYEVLTKDKFVCNSYLRANQIPSVNDLGVIINGQVLLQGVNEALDLDTVLRSYDDIFFKNVCLEASEGVINFTKTSSKIYTKRNDMSNLEIRSILNTGIWMVQKRVESHKRIQAINASALNTTRIITIIDGTKPTYLAGWQAFATGDATTDSWDKGSLYVGLDHHHSCLMDKGYFNVSNPDRSVVYYHPDSKIVFKNYELPYINESIELCKKAHGLFYNNFLIGWDVAITDDGPLILEANEKPGIFVIQAIHGGIRKRITDCYRKVGKYL